MQNKFLNVLWYYPSYAPIRQQKLDAYFESIKEDAVNGDDFASYAFFVVDIVLMIIQCTVFYNITSI